MAMLFDIINPAPAIADTSRQAFERILPSLTEREIETFILLCDYLRDTGFEDATGGELAAWSGRLITSLRPRLTDLCAKGWIESMASRPSRAKYESTCHPYRPCLPRESVERAKRSATSERNGAKISGVNECDQALADTSPIARPVRRSDHG